VIEIYDGLEQQIETVDTQQTYIFFFSAPCSTHVVYCHRYVRLSPDQQSIDIERSVFQPSVRNTLPDYMALYIATL